ncbi:MAG: metallophosphoesterase family protein [Chlorobiota bacterium]|nr:metallophosphoesterase family protein [Chlorobiota bacterium]QQS67285.1 MAG: metallophosphoesterase family protein [Chlorobiota bacterium]
MKLISFLLLFNVICLFSQTIILPTNTAWKYLDDGSDQGSNWKTSSYNDASWQSGLAELGYGDNPITTLAGQKITYYFRNNFTISTPNQYYDYTINLRRDDGAIIYINGVEIYRDNINPGIVNYLTPAIENCSDDGNAIQQVTIPNTFFNQGVNNISVEIHNVNTTSSDITFELELIGNTSPSTPQITRGAFMTLSSNNSITLNWTTNIPSSSEVKIGGEPGNLYSVASINDLVNNHSITLTGLQSNTKYFYSIGKIGTTLQSSGNSFFYTAPNPDSTNKLRFIVTGDMGDGSANQIQVRDAFSNYTNNSIVNGWIWLGDNAYNNGTELEYQNYIFNIYSNQLRYLPLFPALGNHDYANVGYLSSVALGTNFPYFSIFNLQTNTGNEKYYSFNYANIHFITLDSYGALNAPGSPMYNWLSEDLQSNSQRWTIVNFHHPPYTKGTHNSDTEIEDIDIRQNIVPLLEQYGVDLVMCGHSHTYERSKFIKGHQGLSDSFNDSLFPNGNVVQAGNGAYYKYSNNDNGTIYVVCGSSGRISSTTSNGYPHKAMLTSFSNLGGSLILDIEKDSLNCKFLTAAGTIRDEFDIVKKVRGATSVNQNIGTNSKEEQTKSSNVKVNYNAIDKTLNFKIQELKENKSLNNSKIIIELFNIQGEELLKYNSLLNSTGETIISIQKNSLPNQTGIYFIKALINNRVIFRDKILLN